MSDTNFYGTDFGYMQLVERSPYCTTYPPVLTIGELVVPLKKTLVFQEGGLSSLTKEPAYALVRGQSRLIYYNIGTLHLHYSTIGE